VAEIKVEKWENGGAGEYCKFPTQSCKFRTWKITGAQGFDSAPKLPKMKISSPKFRVLEENFPLRKKF